ncbi:hypothetical protein HGRIS_000590 [Hohenbuehelia grisea]|uniref:Uncharacterized protein n=1 Tax=Hohenbuehelia grisea TaxID=104357 RepID=A0ABR3JSE2_9AGAR
MYRIRRFISPTLGCGSWCHLILLDVEGLGNCVVELAWTGDFTIGKDSIRRKWMIAVLGAAARVVDGKDMLVVHRLLLREIDKGPPSRFRKLASAKFMEGLVVEEGFSFNPPQVVYIQ